ncbi:MAG: ChaB family protein, partial [Acidobacteria bacterium]|nr:ChaB family protein [Acidobacteriota bacterium]
MPNSIATNTQEASVKRTRAEYEALETKHELLKKKFRLMQQAIRMIVGLYGSNDDFNGLAKAMLTPDAPDTAIANPTVMEANIVTFTNEADYLFGDGAMNQEQRLALSSAIGAALATLNAQFDADPLLAPMRSMPTHVDPPVTTAVIVPQIQSTNGGITDAVPTTVQESAHTATDGTRRLTEVVLSEATIDDTGHIDGVIVVEGRSLNGNVYTRGALESGLPVFKGKPIYIDHPSKTEEADRPERSVRDLVGRIVETYIGTDKAERPALRHKSVVSSAEQALLTKVREGILGDMSINANGKGQQDPATGDFIVEAFTDAVSLDFVTLAAAGGDATLVESARGEEPTAHAATQSPDIPREATMPISLQEAQRQHKQIVAAVRAGRAQVRKGHAEHIVSESLAASKLPEVAQKRIRAALEPTITRYANAGVPKLELEPAKTQFIEAVRRHLKEAPGDPIAPTGAGLSAGDPPTVEIPPDVAELPPEAQSLWLSAYTDALPQGVDQAVHMAWAAVYSAGYYKDDSGAWQLD